MPLNKAIFLFRKEKLRKTGKITEFSFRDVHVTRNAAAVAVLLRKASIEAIESI
jgi:hypothetical protein